MAGHLNGCGGLPQRLFDSGRINDLSLMSFNISRIYSRHFLLSASAREQQIDQDLCFMHDVFYEASDICMLITSCLTRLGDLIRLNMAQQSEDDLQENVAVPLRTTAQFVSDGRHLRLLPTHRT